MGLRKVLRSLTFSGISVNMADITSSLSPLFLRDEELSAGLDLLFCAFRDVAAESDPTLVSHSFGRAHHRVVYFVGRNPGITVSELLAILRITKQSLSRVLGQLVAKGFIAQRPGRDDRRRRMLTLTDAGVDLERKLTAGQRARIARAYRAAGPQAVEGYRKVLAGLIDGDGPKDHV